jgi:hypothetical protein
MGVFIRELESLLNDSDLHDQPSNLREKDFVGGKEVHLTRPVIEKSTAPSAKVSKSSITLGPRRWGRLAFNALGLMATIIAVVIGIKELSVSRLGQQRRPPLYRNH